MAKRDLRVVLSVVLYIGAGIVLTFVASYSLSANDYATYVTFAAFIGVVLLGPAAALEQESTLVFRAPQSVLRGVSQHVISRALSLCAFFFLLLFLIPGSLMTSFFGEDESFVRLLLLVGVPGLIASSTLRGNANVKSSTSAIVIAHTVFGLSLLVIPLILYFSGVSTLRSLLIGNVASWATPGIFLLLARVWRLPANHIAHDNSAHLSTWLVLTNLLLLGLLLSSQLLFKLQSGWMSIDDIADAQLLISVSCLSSTLSLGLLPYLVARTQGETLSVFLHRSVTRMIGAVGVLIPIMTALLSPSLISIFFGRSSELPTTAAWLISFSATPLVLVVLAVSYLIAQRLVRLAMTFCAVTVSSLWVLPLTVSRESIIAFSFWILIGSTIGLLTLFGASHASRGLQTNPVDERS